MTDIEEVHKNMEEKNLLPLLHLKIPVNIIEGKFNEHSIQAILSPRMLRGLEVVLMPWYGGGLNQNLEYEFSLVLSGFGKEFEVKREWAKNSVTIIRKEVKEDG